MSPKTYINNSVFSVDNFFKDDRWLYRIKINDYQLVTILWNLFLVVIPFMLAYLLIKFWQRTGFERLSQKIIALAIWFVWLLFIPNTVYIISEVRHLLNYCPIDSPFQVCEKNAWMVLFFFTYSAIGWVTFVYLLNQMKNLLTGIFGKLFAELFTFLTIPVIALGFLFGLVNRWNSWEFFIYPKQIYQNSLVYFNNPLHFTNLLIFTTFLYILYWTGTLIFKNRN